MTTNKAQRDTEWRWERDYEEICRLERMDELRVTDDDDDQPAISDNDGI